MSNLIVEILRDNKGKFRYQDYQGLIALAEQSNGYKYRKLLEETTREIPYLPSFKQRLEDTLFSIGLCIDVVPANDGTGRKLYSLRVHNVMEENQ